MNTCRRTGEPDHSGVNPATGAGGDGARFATPLAFSQTGAFAAVDPFDDGRDGAALFATVGGAQNAGLWRYMAIGPFDDEQALRTMLMARNADDWRTIVFRDAARDRVLGMASFMRIRPEHASVEIGCVVIARDHQRTTAATEAIMLLLQHVFADLGYRRCEWKCDSTNEASRRAASRFGFVFEGVFRQDMMVRGRNRDTAWFSMLDSEWPAASAAFTAWSAPGNFGPDGAQRRPLASFRA